MYLSDYFRDKAMVKHWTFELYLWMKYILYIFVIHIHRRGQWLELKMEHSWKCADKTYTWVYNAPILMFQFLVNKDIQKMYMITSYKRLVM